MFNKIKSNSGMTLVEIIVSLAILGMVIGPLSTLFVSGIRNNSLSSDRAIANQLAQKHMEIELAKDIPTGHTLTQNGMTITASVYNHSTDYKYDKGSAPSVAFDTTINTSAVSSEYNSLSDTNLDNEINVKLLCDGDKEISFKNTTPLDMNIYMVPNNPKKDVKVNCLGKVYIHDNIYDNQTITSENEVKKIQVIVTKNGREISKLSTFKTNK